MKETTKTSAPANWNKCSGSGRSPGFTLVELMVVMILLGLFVFISLPRLDQRPSGESFRGVSGWIIGQVHRLKETSRREQQTYVLHADLDRDRFWVTAEAMDESERIQAEQQALALPDDVRITDVVLWDGERRVAGRVDVYFHRKGYSDRAVIHLADEKDQSKSFLIEPFLDQVKMYASDVGFAD